MGHIERSETVKLGKWRAGLAYEHVFDGDAEGAVNSHNIDVPTLEGDTGIMDVGVSVKLNADSPWNFYLGAKGYVGDREGVCANMMVRCAF